MWYSSEEIEAKLKGFSNKKGLYEIFLISIIVDECIYSSDYEISEHWSEAITLTQAGVELLRKFEDGGIKYNDALSKFTLFRLMYHTEILIDVDNSDYLAIKKLVSALLASKYVFLPYVFENILYDKFNKEYRGNKTRELDHSDAMKLLEGTPKGVFQMGNHLTGPLGFLESLENRLIIPTTLIALWHCSDPGCNAKHTMNLESSDNAIENAKKTCTRYIVDHIGRPSEWSGPILHSFIAELWPDGKYFADLPSVISDCILGADRKALCISALKSKHNQYLMQVLRQIGKTGAPEEVTLKLSPEEQLQLLLLLTDDYLIKLIDEKIINQVIKIPPSEIRTPMTGIRSFGDRHNSSISSLGIRSISHPPLIHLIGIIWEAYTKTETIEDLEWRLRDIDKGNLRASLAEYIKINSPESSIRELILPSKEVSIFVCDELKVDSVKKRDDQICEIILWKLGFEIPRFELNMRILRDRIENFRTVALLYSKITTESDRSAIRSSGVNLFVSIEEWLENLVCYNAWALGSDHFGVTKFKYRKQDALQTVPRLLGHSIQSGTLKLEWDSNGANTLSVLIAYVIKLDLWIKGMHEQDKSQFLRAPNNLPHYINDKYFIFPLMHTELWADLTPNSIASYSSIFSRVAFLISQSNLASIRNGLDHKRDDEDFPTSDALLACVTRIHEMIEIIDHNNLTPKLYWPIRFFSDSFGHTTMEYSDYKGNKIQIYGPPTSISLPMFDLKTPKMIFSAISLAAPNSAICFEDVPKTNYWEFWKGYPQSRKIPTATSAIEASE